MQFQKDSLDNSLNERDYMLTYNKVIVFNEV